MDEELTFAWTFIMRFILGMALLGTGMFFLHQTPLTDVTRAYAEIAAIQGGYTADDITNMKSDLQKAGFDPNKIVITVQAFDINGTNISCKAVDVTPLSQSPYPATPNFSPRGSKITTVVYSTEETTMNEVNKFLTGTASSIKHSVRRVVMSERIK